MVYLNVAQIDPNHDLEQKSAVIFQTDNFLAKLNCQRLHNNWHNHN